MNVLTEIHHGFEGIPDTDHTRLEAARSPSSGYACAEYVVTGGCESEDAAT